jgi:hypothetical protein
LQTQARKSSPFPSVAARPCVYQARTAALSHSQDTVLERGLASESRGCRLSLLQPLGSGEIYT